MTPVPKAPAGPVRAHIKHLIHQGMTQAAIIREADISSAYLSSLLHGEYKRGGAPVIMMNAYRAARILGIRYEPPEPNAKPAPTSCPSGLPFEPIGYRVGRCSDCGQIAPVHRLRGSDGYMDRLMAHPTARSGELVPVSMVNAIRQHPDCGTTKGHNRHMREKTVACEPCKAAKRGYENGRANVLSAVHRAQQSAVPWSLIEECEAAARAMVFRKPYPQLRDLSVRVLRAVEAARGTTAELQRAMAA